MAVKNEAKESTEQKRPDSLAYRRLMCDGSCRRAVVSWWQPSLSCQGFRGHGPVALHHVEVGIKR